MSFIRNELERNNLEKLSKAVSDFSSRANQLDETRDFPFENIKELKKIGYTKLTLPKEFGGGGKGLYEFILCQEKIAEHCGPTALSIGWHVGNVLQMQDGKRGWNIDVLHETFEKINNGALVNRAASEPQTGSPTRGGKPTTTAVKTNGKWVINGRKNYTSMAPVLDLFIVSAWIVEESKVGWFLIDRDTPGLSIEKTWDVMSMQGTASEDLLLENVSIDEKYLVEYASSGFDTSSLLHIPACYLGIASAARNYAVDFAKNHSPNSISGTISELPNVRNKIGEMEIELLQSRYFLYGVAAKCEAQPELQQELQPQLAAVKKAVTNSAISIVDQSMRVVGAVSLQRSNPLQRYYRDVRSGLHNPPMDDATINLLAQYAIEK
ncbi:acyl-CoA/acyl-ACP dehydrogenase [Bacillus sp. FJAT-29790]|uniref:acyl-CoA dehydrogenase family protein n=1 Tax=Bacillus sp. FJAT-29790 TaxID=1895002 RepID=UPI001C23C162|nr:acyl-CoA dehydrogenase family protein [Bacillus sp. FJAT-29790]MBU8880444.1 acyl-CoA/acyl-ACP dehydrogenase [Bacillus sp. FJAT-29790]